MNTPQELQEARETVQGEKRYIAQVRCEGKTVQVILDDRSELIGIERVAIDATFGDFTHVRVDAVVCQKAPTS